MRTALSRLVLLLAALAMPLGMASAAASAPASDHRAMITAKEPGHCSDRPDKQQHHDGRMTCSMACASALPAALPVQDSAAVPHDPLVAPVATRSLHGILPEIATPPPKSA